tara:strand:- start:109 stop:417 length:309 start_codon:yes stop_codon:yes gene_type:complete
MKILITENRRVKLIQNYILSTFPEVVSVDISDKKVLLGNDGPRNKQGEIIIVNLITVNFKSGEMQISPTTTLRKIMKQVDSIFGLDLNEFASKWDFAYKMVN